MQDKDKEKPWPFDFLPFIFGYKVESNKSSTSRHIPLHGETSLEIFSSKLTTMLHDVANMTKMILLNKKNLVTQIIILYFHGTISKWLANYCEKELFFILINEIGEIIYIKLAI